MKLIKIVLLMFAVSLAQPHNLNDKNTSTKQPQVNDMNLFFPCSQSLTTAVRREIFLAGETT